MSVSFLRTVVVGIVIFSISYFITDYVIHRVFSWNHIIRALEVGAIGGTITAWQRTRFKDINKR